MSRRRRRLAGRAADCARSLLAFLFSNVGVIVLVVAYTIAGAFMFQAIEGAREMEQVAHMALERDNTANYLWQNVTLRFNPLNETALKKKISSELRQYQSKIVVAVRKGWDGGRSNRQWSFSSAFLYSLTVITTIGYGHLSPRTSWGKVTTIFYALLGMPLFLLYLTNVGELLARWFKCIYALCCLCRGCPGFTRRRVVRLRTQLEISEAESIERPDGWRPPYLDLDVTPEYRHPPLSPKRYPPDRYPRVRHPPDGYPPDRYLPDRYLPDRCAPDFRIPPYRHPSEKYPLDYRNLPIHRNVPNRYSRDRNNIDYRNPPYREDYRNPLYREDYRSPPDFRNLNSQDHRYPKDYRYQERYPPDFRYQPHPQRHFQRRPDYFRSASMPQPWESSRYQSDPRIRGWSEPLGYRSEESSDFSYVTFDAQTITVPLSVCVFIMVGYLIFGSMLFGMWESWNQLDGAYFCFISLTSIGFGDFVPGERVYTPRIETSFIVCSIYLLLGMALVAMCFNLMQEQVIHYVAGLKRAVKRICRCKR